MHIIHITSEMAPIATFGGLAEVILGLSRALLTLGHDADIILPRYDCLDSRLVRDFVYQGQFTSYFDGKYYKNNVYVGWAERIKVYFIHPLHPKFFFDRGCIYGCSDDVERFLYFSRASLDFLAKKKISPHILHLHDWQTAVLAPLYYDYFYPKGYKKPKIVFTAHKFQEQGQVSFELLDKIGLKGSSYLTQKKMQDHSNPGLINLIKGAINYSDFITTASPTYTDEILTQKQGHGLNRILMKNKHKLKGILNGLDKSYWNPEIDPKIFANYSKRLIPKEKKDKITIDRKAFNKKKLREKLNLQEKYGPILSIVSRLVSEKKIDLLSKTIDYVVKKGGQFIILGTPQSEKIYNEINRLKNKYSYHPDIYINLQYKEDLSHLIFAGSDMCILPSFSEPSGITQMIALQYGSIPIVEKSGVSCDIIKDEKTGFFFQKPNIKEIKHTVDKAFTLWFDNKQKWQKLMIKAMSEDYSWTKSAKNYLKIYQYLVKPST